MITIVSMLLSSGAMAQQECGKLFLEISNDTKEQCKLYNMTVIRGVMDQALKREIEPGGSLRLEAEQTFYGPEVELTFDCNGKKTTLHSQQNFCLFHYGKLQANIVAQDPGLVVTHYMIEGSYYNKIPGRVTWVIADEESDG